MSVGHALLAFTIAAGLLAITPGIDTALVLRTATVEGRRRALLAGMGICSGVLLWGLATSVGLSTLLTVSRFAFNALRIAGAGYLLYLGVRLLVRKRIVPVNGIHVFTQSKDESDPNWFLRGFLTNILNPKVGVFYVSFLPQFIPRWCGGSAIQHVAGFDSRYRELSMVFSAKSRYSVFIGVVTTSSRRYSS